MAVASIKGSAGGYKAWTRPSDWLALPTVNVGDQKIVLLVHAMPNSPNTVGITVQGAYTVDWGDGSASANFASGALATHAYDYTVLSSATATSDGYRQAIMTVTMQSGQSMTSVVMTSNPTGTSGQYVQPYREMVMAGSSVANLGIGAGGVSATSGLRWFTYVGPAGSLAAPTLTNLTQLRGVTGTQWTAAAPSVANLFSGCTNLETVPLLDLTACTNANLMFGSCSRLRSVPLFNTANVTNFSSMFSSCASLGSIPLFDTSKGTNMSGMFSGCVTLTTIPLLNTALNTTFANMFATCTTLASIPAIDTGNGTSFNQMFLNCVSLASLPAALNTAKGIDFTSMFQNNNSLLALPTMDVGQGTSFGNMLISCMSLVTVALNSAKGTAFGGLCTGCTALRSLTLDLTLAPSTTSVANLFNGTTLTAMILTGLRFAPPSAATVNQQMSAAALNALYTSLGTASGAQTLVVSGNPGSGSSTISIATAKGWTVTGG